MSTIMDKLGELRVMVSVVIMVSMVNCSWSLSGCTWSTSSLASSSMLECRLRVLDYRVHNGSSELISAESARSLRVLCSDAFAFESQLRSDHFGSLNRLERLELRRCRLRHLPPRAFVGLMALDELGVHTLNADWNAAGVELELDAEAFVGLDTLTKLDLSESNVHNLPEKALCPMRNLAVLNLSSNAFDDLEKLNLKDECQLSKLHSLILDHNGVDSLSRGSLTALSALKKLDLSHNTLSVLAEDTLATMKTLETLDMSHNLLMALPPKLFSFTPNLRQLHLANNSLGTVDLEAFSSLAALRILDLSKNNLDENWIKTGLFSGLHSLVFLDLSHNHIARLDVDLFVDLGQLQVLNLEHNLVHTMASTLFTNTVHLHTLLLSHNKLESVPHQTLNTLSELKSLQLNDNALHSLHPVLLRNCSSLTKLSLASNLLTQVPEAVHKSESLESLDLSNNVIGLLKRESLQKLPNLVSLKLNHNELSRIDEGAFVEASNLLDLDLSANRFKKLEQETLKSLNKLRSLNLAENDLDDINGLLQHQSELKWLNVSSNQLAWFDYAFIPSSLEWLDVSHNRIDGLANYYKLMEDYNLKYIDASHNRIRALSTLAILPTLELVLLNDNDVEEVDDDTFVDKLQLKHVHLERNQLRSLKSNALRISRLKSQPSFWLSSNPWVCSCELEWLKHVSSRVELYPRVGDLSELECLVYNHSHVGHRRRLSRVADDEFLCQYEKHCLDNCLCCDFFACDCQMQCPKGCLCLHDNSLKTNVVQCSDRAHTSIPEKVPMDATDLYLDNNNLTTLDSALFSKENRLRRLFIRESGLTHIYNDSFVNLVNLLSLHLESNLLKRLDGTEFRGLDNLQELFLQRNQLVSIASGSFKDLKHLRVLRLDANLLIDFRVWELSANSQLSYLTLANNWWQCECEFVRNFRMFIDGNVDVVADAADVVCTSAQDDTAHHLAVSLGTQCELATSADNLDVDVMINKSNSTFVNSTLPLLLLLLLLLLVISILLIGCTGWRERLLVYLHSRHGIRIVMAERKSSEPMLFDALVLHSQKDVNIVEALVHQLEPLGFKLCLHYRDLNGLFASETFQPAMNVSRRKIVVLSSAFLASEWEQVRALNVLDAIVIVAADFDLSNMRNCNVVKRSRVVLKFGSRRFWPTLKFHLPDPSAPKVSTNNVFTKKLSVTSPNTTNGMVRSAAGGAELDLSGAWTYTSMDNINESVLSSTRLLNQPAQQSFIMQQSASLSPLQQHFFPEPPVRKKSLNSMLEPQRRLSSLMEVAHTRSASNELLLMAQRANNNSDKIEHQRSRSCGLAKVQSFHANNLMNNPSNVLISKEGNSVSNSRSAMATSAQQNRGGAAMSSLAMIPLLRAQHDHTPESMYGSNTLCDVANVAKNVNVSRSTSMLCNPARRAPTRRPRAVGAEDPGATPIVASPNRLPVVMRTQMANANDSIVQHHRSISSPLTQGFVL